MYVAIVTFDPPAVPPDNPRKLLESTAPAYRQIPGLERKYFIGNERAAGGIYQWHDRDSALRYYDDAWRARMADRYGVEPTVELFRAPCLVDNVAGEVLFGEDRA